MRSVKIPNKPNELYSMELTTRAMDVSHSDVLVDRSQIFKIHNVLKDRLNGRTCHEDCQNVKYQNSKR